MASSAATLRPAISFSAAAFTDSASTDRLTFTLVAVSKSSTVTEVEAKVLSAPST